MFDPTKRRQLWLTQDWEAAWTMVLKPWLTRSGDLHPGYVVVPTRGQARALRLRMAGEGIVSVGVRFVTPGLIRQLPFGKRDGGGEVPGQGVLEFGLKGAVARWLERHPDQRDNDGLARSLLSRPSGPLEDWADLLRAGLSEDSFPHPFVRSVFRDLRLWLGRQGLSLPVGETPGVADRLDGEAGRPASRALIYGFSAEHWQDWPELARLCARTDEVAGVLPYPSFEGKPLEENWVALLERVIGAEALSLPDQEERASGQLARSWALNLSGDESSTEWADASVLVGTNPAAEAELLFGQVVTWLATPGARIAVIFPTASPVVADLAEKLTLAGVRFCDEIATTGAPSGETGLLRAVLAYQRGGCRLEDLWALARRLRGTGQLDLKAGESRGWIERVFDGAQSHRVEDALRLPEAATLRGGQSMVDLAGSVGFWPERLTVGRAAGRLKDVAIRWGLDEPGWMGGVNRLIERDGDLHPRDAVIDLLSGSLPERAPRSGLQRDDFAPVVLTTRKRATAQVWTHVVFAGCNAEGWPSLPEETFWLSDDARRELNRRSKTVTLPLAEDAAILERLGILDICNNVLNTVALSSCLRVNDGSESDRSPHPWLERILLQKVRTAGGDGAARPGWRELARRPGAGSAGGGESTAGWAEVWRGRRDPSRAFDGHSYCPGDVRMGGRRWAARLLERGYEDPVILWYEGVLRLEAVREEPMERSRRKEMGLLAHRLIAEALRGDHAAGSVFPFPGAEVVSRRLEGVLAAWRRSRPDDAYWHSFHLELAALSRHLLNRVLGGLRGSFLGVEFALPGGTAIPTRYGPLGVSGRLDLVMLDQPEWPGASVTIVDFKTGADRPLRADRMAGRGQSLQLGVYLKAAMERGARCASVRMVRPEEGTDSELTDEELEGVQSAFDRLGLMILTGRFGQLTADRNRFQRTVKLPLACVPVAQAVLVEKFGRTFPEWQDESAGESGTDESAD